MAGNFNYTDLIGPGLGALGSLVGNKMQANASKAGVEEQKRQFDIKNAQQNQVRSMLMPVLAKRIGVANPGLGSMPSGPGYAGPQQGGGGGFMNTAGKVAGIASSVAPLLSKIPGIGGVGGIGGIAGAAGHGLGALGGMIGAAGPAAPIAAGVVGAGLLAKKFIGQGRKQADKLTGNGGAQEEFGNLMKEIAARQAGGQMTDEQARAALGKALEYTAGNAMQFAGQGKNQQKVVRQWLGDFSNADWMRDHPELQPIAQKYLGSMG